jgi:signal transduction histidine kinase
MSSGIAAPIGGRLLRTRALVHESPREHERTRLRRYLRVTTLQALEYLACDGYGAELDAETIRGVADDTAVEMRGCLLRLGVEEPCELVSSLEQVVSSAQKRGTVEVEMVTELRGSIYGAEAAALVGAVREALNNVHKHAKASRVVVRCETSESGARVVVSDDGVGVDLAHATAGIGLRHSIVGRMVNSGGRAIVASEPGHGTLVTLTTRTTQEVAA